MAKENIRTKKSSFDYPAIGEPLPEGFALRKGKDGLLYPYKEAKPKENEPEALSEDEKN